MLRSQGSRWAMHVLEGPISWILSALYIASTVIAGGTPLSAISNAVAASGGGGAEQESLNLDEAVRACQIAHGPTDISSASGLACLAAAASSSATSTTAQTTAHYIRAVIDAAIYIFLPIWTTWLIRLLQGRHVLHRVSGRTVTIGDIPWVAQSIEAYLSKLFALSYR